MSNRRTKVLSPLRTNKVSYYEMTNYHPAEVRESKGITRREFEASVRDQCRGASKEEMKAFYTREVYNKK